MFQCHLDETFRDFDCSNSNIGLKYITSSILSPKLGTLYICYKNKNNCLKLLFILDDIKLQFCPSSTLGNKQGWTSVLFKRPFQSLRSFTFLNYVYYKLYFSDVISIENQQTVAKNVFAELKNQYNKLIHCRKDSFISQLESKTVKDVDYKAFTFQLTLLPHQMLIMPLEFKSAISRDVLFALKVYDDEEIRYL